MKYFVYIGHPPKLEGSKGQANFFKEITTAGPLFTGNLLLINEQYYVVDSVLYCEDKIGVVVFPCNLSFQFNPLPHLVNV